MVIHIDKHVHESHSLISFLDKISFTKVFFLWLILILIFGMIFFGIQIYIEDSIIYNKVVIESNIKGFIDSTYFSFITATSLGLGDAAPLGISRFIAGIETILGLIIYGLLISKLVGVRQKIILEEIYDISFEEVIDRLRSALYLFRSDINRILEKIDSNTIKQREITDIWMLFSSLDMTLTDIKKIIIPPRISNHFHKGIDTFRLELLFNSMQLSLDKILEFIRILKVQNIKWRTNLLMKSMNGVVIIIDEIVDYQIKKSNKKKVEYKINELKNTSVELRNELKEEHKKEEAKGKSK